MRQCKLLDELSAAEVMGVERSMVLGWCKNNVINCESAPKEYADRTKYLIEEDECNYIGGLVKKYGTRGALLNYKKSWRNPTVKGEEKEEEMIDSMLWSLDEDIYYDEPTTNFEPTKQTQPTKKTERNPDKLVSTVLYAHSLKEKIAKFEDELSKLRAEYTEIKDVIVNQL